MDILLIYFSDRYDVGQLVLRGHVHRGDAVNARQAARLDAARLNTLLRLDAHRPHSQPFHQGHRGHRGHHSEQH